MRYCPQKTPKKLISIHTHIHIHSYIHKHGEHYFILESKKKKNNPKKQKTKKKLVIQLSGYNLIRVETKQKKKNDCSFRQDISLPTTRSK